MDDVEVKSGSLLVAGDGTIAECNEQLARMVGRSAADLLGRPLVDVLITDPVEVFTIGGPFRSLPAWLQRQGGERVPVAVRPFPLSLVGQDEATWLVVARTTRPRRGVHVPTDVTVPASTRAT